jgi:hypothetical protein
MGKLTDIFKKFTNVEKILFVVYIIYVLSFIILIPVIATGYIKSWYWLLIPGILTIITIITDLVIRGKNSTTIEKSL